MAEKAAVQAAGKGHGQRRQTAQGRGKGFGQDYGQVFGQVWAPGYHVSRTFAPRAAISSLHRRMLYSP